MADIVTRAGKGSPLTFAEVDANFTNLNNAKLELSGGNAGATIVTAASSTTARSLANRAADVVNVKDFGAVGNGVTDDTAAITAANLTGKPVYTPYSSAGTYASTINFFGLLNNRFFGSGRLKTTDVSGSGSYAQARDRVFITNEVEVPDSERSKYFNNAGWSLVPYTAYGFYGGSVGSTPPTGYKWLDLASLGTQIFDYGGGANVNLNNNADRTGATANFTQVYHGGQGDAGARRISAQVYSTKVGATHFLASPAVGVEAADISSTSSTNGVYLQHSEANFIDNGSDVAAIDRVRNYWRTNDTGALYTVWIHDFPNSLGSKPIDAFYQPSGLSNRGIDNTHANYGTNQAAIVFSANQRFYWNGVASAPDTAGASFKSTLDNNYDFFDGTNRIFNLSSTSNSFAFKVNGTTVASISPSASAALDVTSTIGGFLPPRMTGTQRDAIGSPANGLVLYNTTTNKLQVRAAGAWVDLH